MTLPATGWYAELPSSFQQQLLLWGRRKSLDAGQWLFRRGDTFCGIYAVCQGHIQISGLQHNGREAPLTLLFAGDWFGEVALFDQLARTHDAVAITPVELWQLPPSNIQQMIKQDPAWWPLLGQLLTAKLRQAFIELEQRALLSAKARLAQRLWQWSAWQSKIEISQDQLAQCVCLSRQTTNQLLRQLQASRLIKLEYGGITVLKRAELQHVALQELE